MPYLIIGVYTGEEIEYNCFDTGMVVRGPYNHEEDAKAVISKLYNSNNDLDVVADHFDIFGQRYYLKQQYCIDRNKSVLRECEFDWHVIRIDDSYFNRVL